MGRSPCCDGNGLKKGPWTTEEDEKLRTYIKNHGHGSWRALPKLAGLNRCGKSCRLRWTNYLRPDIKRGKFSEEEERTILHWHSILGNKWSAIAVYLSGRTDNEIKNFWNTRLKKKLIQMGIDPTTHKPRTDVFSSLTQIIALANIRYLLSHRDPFLDHHAMRLQADSMHLTELQYLQPLLRSTAAATSPAASIDPYCPSFEAAVNMLCTALPPPIKENLGGVLNSQLLLQLHQNQSQIMSQLSPGPQQAVQEAVPFSFVPTVSLSSELAQPYGSILMSQLGEGGGGKISDYNVPLPPEYSPWGFPAPPVDVETSDLGEVGSTTMSYGGGSPSPPDWLADYI